MANVQAGLFDYEVLKRINLYISANNLSIEKIAKESGMTYIQLWSLLKRNKSIKLSDYISLCNAFNEPIDMFIPK